MKIIATTRTAQGTGASRRLRRARAFQMHPYKPQVLHIDFQRIAENEKVTMRVPLHFSGEEESPAVKVDKAIISHAAAYVEVTCMPRELPEFVAVDLSGMTLGTTLRAADLKLPEGVSVHHPDVVIASVIAKVEEEVTAAEGEEAAAPAAAAE